MKHSTVLVEGEIYRNTKGGRARLLRVTGTRVTLAHIRRDGKERPFELPLWFVAEGKSGWTREQSQS